MSTELEALLAEARNPATSLDRLWKLITHSEVEVRRALLNNPNLCHTDEHGELNTDLLEELAYKFPEEVAEHPLFVLHALIEPTFKIGGVVSEVVRQTKNVGLIEQVFRTWGSASWKVREAVAMNLSTPGDVLRTLGNQQSELYWRVREAVASNPSAPEDLLRTLGNPATESDSDVRVAVAKNPSTPEDTLRILSNPKTDPEWRVLEAAQKALLDRGLT